MKETNGLCKIFFNELFFRFSLISTLCFFHINLKWHILFSSLICGKETIFVGIEGTLSYLKWRLLFDRSILNWNTSIISSVSTVEATSSLRSTTEKQNAKNNIRLILPQDWNARTWNFEMFFLVAWNGNGLLFRHIEICWVAPSKQTHRIPELWKINALTIWKET